MPTNAEHNQVEGTTTIMANKQEQTAVEIKNISKTFGNVTALDSISLTVEKGEFFFLLGPSGCGKTTLLRILAGLEEPDSGTVFFDGKDITELPAHRRAAPMVFQNYAVWPHLNVFDNVAFGPVEAGLPKNVIKKDTNRALELVGLENLDKRMPGQLSGGQQQRVALARAIVMKPTLILLDEPLSNLDAKLRCEMREELERLHSETNLTFIFVTHDQTEALSLANRMAILKDGKIEGTGTPKHLYHRPPNLFCSDFLGEANLLPGQVREFGEDLLKVSTPIGLLEASPKVNTRYQKGMPVTCVIRPEYIHLPGRSHDANEIRGRVERVRPNGPIVNISLSCGDMQLKASLLNQFRLDFKEKDQLTWEISAHDILALPEEINRVSS